MKTVLALALAALLVGCAQANKDVVCNQPYMRFADGCCLDQNKNAICDPDEQVAESTASEKIFICKSEMPLLDLDSQQVKSFAEFRRYMANQDWDDPENREVAERVQTMSDQEITEEYDIVAGPNGLYICSSAVLVE